MSAWGGQSFAVVVFLGFVAVSLLLCGLAAADLDDPEHFYAGGSAAFGPVGGGLAIAGDYVSAATLLSTTGAVALDGADGVLFACATVVSLFLVLRILGEPLRRKGVFTLGDFLADQLDTPSARRAPGVATLVVLTPLLLVQLSTAGRIMAAMLGLPDAALAGCTVAGGALMVCYAAFGGMRGIGYVQILKVGVALVAMLLLAGVVLARFGWSPPALLDSARDRSGAGAAYLRPGLHFGHSVAGRLDLISFEATLLVGAACLPHITMRLHPVGKARTARRAVGWAVGPVMVVCAAVVVAGLGACALIGRGPVRAADPGGATALLMVTGALDPVSGGAGHSMLFAVVACAVFATTLAAVAGITLAAASSLARDFATACPRERTPLGRRGDPPGAAGDRPRRSRRRRRVGGPRGPRQTDADLAVFHRRGVGARAGPAVRALPARPLGHGRALDRLRDPSPRRTADRGIARDVGHPVRGLPRPRRPLVPAPDPRADHHPGRLPVRTRRPHERPRCPAALAGRHRTGATRRAQVRPCGTQVKVPTGAGGRPDGGR